MSKTLYVPDNIANAKKKETTAQAAYIKKEDRVLDPSLLDKSLLERLPQPTGWRVLVMPYQGKVKTDGGVFLPDQVVQREAVATVVAYVLKVGPWLM